IRMPAPPTGIVLGPAGKKLYVTCAAPISTVVVLDVASGKEIASIPTGHTAMGPAISPDGKTLYVCNRFDNEVAVIDLVKHQETARVATSREPVAAAITPDGATLFVANLLPPGRADTFDTSAVVTAIDTASNEATSIRLPNGSTAVRGLCVSPDGKTVFAVHVMGRYHLPATHVAGGWLNTSAMRVIDVAEKRLVDAVLLDDVELGAANPWGITFTADGKSICISHAGTHELSVIDAKGLMKRLLGEADGRMKTAKPVQDDLAFLVGLRRRVNLQGGDPLEPFDPTLVNGPRGLTVVGAKVFAAAYFSDSLAVVDLAPKYGTGVSRIALGPKPQLSVQRRGEMIFNDATLCLQNWQSCASCHTDARVDGLNRDLLNDGAGTPKNVRSLLLAHSTAPAMSTGNIPNAEGEVRKGLAHILFSLRPEEDAVAIDAYLKSVQPVPSPYLVDGKLSPAAEHGKRLFSAQANCVKCHAEPLYTDGELHDVGSRARYDQRADFDTPTLIEVWRTAPYRHDGQYVTVKEHLVEGKHSEHVEALSEQQVDDLVEFVLSL
ncbi:MAG: c-type cytochrome, partial [Kiritimatiellae bacterium]|nr:c-type cytochrome [Kiritimatiellia bacterium]